MKVEDISAWVALGLKLVELGQTTVGKFATLIQLLHPSMSDEDVKTILKSIETQALSLQKAAEADAESFEYPFWHEGGGE